jgi:hypothetical protein
MDRQTLALLIPIVTMFFTGLIGFSFTPLGRAIARRISGPPPELAERVNALEDTVDTQRRMLDEMHERLDFAERALAQAREARRLPESGAPSPGRA